MITKRTVLFLATVLSLTMAIQANKSTWSLSISNLTRDIAELKQANEVDDAKLKKLSAAIELMGVVLKGQSASTEDKSAVMLHALKTEEQPSDMAAAPIERSMQFRGQVRQAEHRLEALFRKVSTEWGITYHLL